MKLMKNYSFEFNTNFIGHFFRSSGILSEFGVFTIRKKSEFRKKIQIFMKEMVNETKNSIFSWFSMDRGSKIIQKKPKP